MRMPSSSPEVEAALVAPFGERNFLALEAISPSEEVARQRGIHDELLAARDTWRTGYVQRAFTAIVHASRTMRDVPEPRTWPRA